LVKTLKKIKKFNCSPKLNKPVIIPDRKTILSILNEMRDDIVGHFHDSEELVNGMAVFVGERFKVDISHAESPEVEQNDIDFNAFYDSGLDENGDVPIEIYFITNPSNDFIILDSEGFDVVIRRLADSIIHELIHMKQSRSRDFLEVDDMAYTCVEDELLEAQLYLGSTDEIYAYAFNIAHELLDKADLQTCLKKLESPSKIKIEDSINLFCYVNTFAKDVSHPVIKRLIKRVYKTLNEIGKKSN
jgi:hypothetical protein